MTSRLAVTILLCGSSCALAGTIRHDVADSSYTSLANQSKYAATGAVLWSEGASGFIGSGTLVAPNWVLTAGHCVDGTDLAGGGVTNMRFVRGAAVSGGTVNTAAQWFPHPNWTSGGGSLQTGFDLGLIRLNAPITDVPYAKRFFGASEKTMTGTHVGYGNTGTGSTGYTNGTAGTKRAGNNILDAFGGETTTHLNLAGYSSNILFEDFDYDPPGPSHESTMGSVTPLALEYMIAPGDSGGSVYVDVAGQTLLTAVHSMLASIDGTNNADYGDISGSIRLNGTWQSNDDVFTLNDWVSSNITVPGDADADFDVDYSDLTLLAGSYGITTGGHWHLGDFNLDGHVNLNDLGSLADNYSLGAAQAFADFQTLTSIPEPATPSLLALCAAASLQRRRMNRTH